jgi:hypothetical protein
MFFSENFYCFFFFSVCSESLDEILGTDEILYRLSEICESGVSLEASSNPFYLAVMNAKDEETLQNIYKNRHNLLLQPVSSTPLLPKPIRLRRALSFDNQTPINRPQLVNKSKSFSFRAPQKRDSSSTPFVPAKRYAAKPKPTTVRNDDPMEGTSNNRIDDPMEGTSTAHFEDPMEGPSTGPRR